MVRFKIIFATVFIFIAGCGNDFESRDHESLIQTDKVASVPPPDTLITFEDNNWRKIEARVIPAEKPIGTILVLPGWNYPYAHWCDSTQLCVQAIENGFNLILLTTGKTIYQRNIYPETRNDWKEERCLDWFSNNFIDSISSSLGLLVPGQNSYVMGLSTGGRGAFILGKERQDVFKAIASISGDFDQYNFPNDKLYKGFFGERDKFEERYRGEENPLYSIEELIIPVYIGHGGEDQVVKPVHAERLYHALRDEYVDYPCEFHVDSTAGHDYKYWNSEVSNVLSFFKKYTL